MYVSMTLAMANNPESTPAVRWQKLLVKGTVWISAEIMLGLMGLDNIADYSEFLMQNQAVTRLSEAFSNLITMI